LKRAYPGKFRALPKNRRYAKGELVLCEEIWSHNEKTRCLLARRFSLRRTKKNSPERKLPVNLSKKITAFTRLAGVSLYFSKHRVGHCLKKFPADNLQAIRRRVNFKQQKTV
jgi:hypothetical protein